MVPLSYRTASGTSSLLLSEDEQRVRSYQPAGQPVNAGGHARKGRHDNELRSRIIVCLANTRCTRALHVG